MSVKIKKCLFSFILLIIQACEVIEETPGKTAIDETNASKKIEVIYLELDKPNDNAETEDGIVVTAPDINFGKLYFRFRTNYESERFKYYVYLSNDAELSSDDDLMGNAICNIEYVPCFPEAQRKCEFVIHWYECLSHKSKSIDLAKRKNFPEQAFERFLIFQACQYEDADKLACDYQSTPVRFEIPCSKYRRVPYNDQFPLEISNLDIRGQSQNGDGDLLLSNSIPTKQKFWVNWHSNWRELNYEFSLKLSHTENKIKFEETLITQVCNEHTSCYPGNSIMCEYVSGAASGYISCNGNSKVVYINQLTTDHPFNDVFLSFLLEAEDPINQLNHALTTTIQVTPQDLK